MANPSRTRVNRGMIAAIVIFLAAIGLFGISSILGNSTPVSTPTPQPSPVVGLTAAQVSSFVIKAKGQTLTVTRQNVSAWTYALCPDAQPGCSPQPADAHAAEILLNAIVSLRPTATILGAPIGLSAYALQTPTAGEIVVNASSGRLVDLYIGGKDVQGQVDYIRRASGNDVYAVTASTIDTQILGALTNPPKPVPSPSPSPAPSAPPAAVPGAPSPSP